MHLKREIEEGFTQRCRGTIVGLAREKVWEIGLLRTTVDALLRHAEGAETKWNFFFLIVNQSS